MKKNRIILITAISMCVCLLAFVTAFGSETKTASISEEEITSIINTTTDTALISSPFTEVANSVRSSVVGINNYRISSGFYGYGFGYGGQREQTEQLYATGSGVVITSYGHILTNYHVIENATRITVTTDFDDKEYDASVEGYDADKDIAVLYVEDLNIQPVALGDSDALQVGEWAIVIGNPLSENFARTVTVGIVSALDRKVTDTSYDRFGRRTSITNDMIQVDAAINSGNSGGGMFNVLGQLQGIPARKYSSGSIMSSVDVDNIGLCIPINTAKPLIEEVLRGFNGNHTDVIKKGDNTDNSMLNKPRLGVTVATLSSSTTEKLPLGSVVKEVEAGSPAEEAGIKVGDVIVAINDETCASNSALIEKLQTYKEGDTITLTIYRAEGVDTFLETLDLDVIGEGDYIDVDVTLRIIDQIAS